MKIKVGIQDLRILEAKLNEANFNSGRKIR